MPITKATARKTSAPKRMLGIKKERSTEEKKTKLVPKNVTTKLKKEKVVQIDHRKKKIIKSSKHLLVESDEEDDDEEEEIKRRTKRTSKSKLKPVIKASSRNKNNKANKHESVGDDEENDEESNDLSIEESENESEEKSKKKGRKSKTSKANTKTKTQKVKKIESEDEEQIEEKVKKNGRGKIKKQKTDEISVDEEEDDEESEEKLITKKKSLVKSKSQSKAKTKEKAKPKPLSKKKKKEESPKQSESELESEEEKPRKGKGKRSQSKKKDISSFSLKSLPEDTYLKSKKSALITDCCIQCNEKNLFRAIETNDKKLFEKCLKAAKEISRVNSSNSIVDFKTPLQYALIQNNKDLVSTLLEYFKKKHSRALLPKSKLNLESTGQTVLYGVSKNFNLSRGNRLGNNAFFDKEERDVTMVGPYGRKMNSIKTILFNNDEIFNNFKSFTKLIKLDDNQIYTLINDNIEKGNIDIVAFLIKALKSIEMYGYNQLHVAVTQKKNNLEIKNKQSVNKISQMRTTPVHFACINPDPYFLEELLNKGGEKEFQNINGKKPISYAAVCKGTGPLKVLLDYKCNVNDREKNGFTPILYAAKEGRYENVKLLIENGANMSHKARPGSCMAIHFACIKGHLNIVKYLISKDKKMINAIGAERKSCLHFAVIHGHEDIVEYLVKAGANINIKDKFKRTPLLLSCRFGHSRILNYLIQIGAKKDICDNSLNSPLHYACGFGHMECVKLMIESGANISAVSMWKSTPIEIALMKNHFGVVKYILNNSNYDLNSKFSNGKSIFLHILSTIGPESYDELTYILKDKNIDPNITDDCKMNGFHFLSSFTYRSYLINFLTKEDKDNLNEEKHGRYRNDYKELLNKYVTVLIEAGCDPNSLNMINQLPIISALDKQNFELATELLKYTNDITLLDANEFSIFDFCAKNGRILIEECIDFIDTLLQTKKINPDFLNKETRYGKSTLLTICEDFAKNSYNRLYYYGKIEALYYAKKNQEKFKKNNSILRPLSFPRKRKAVNSKAATQFGTPFNANFIEEASKIKEKALNKMTTFLKDKFYPLLTKLISLGANPNQKSGIKHFKNIDKYETEYFNNYGQLTSLMYLISFPIPELISSFIKTNSIDINAKDNLGKTVLFYLIHSGKQIKNVSIDNFNKTFDIIINSNGIDLKAIDNNNNTVFLLCIIESFEEEALKLYQRDNSIDINKSNNEKIHPLLHFMSQANFNRKLVQFIIANFPIDVNCKDAKMQTPLHHSAINNDSSQEIDYTLWKLLFDKKGDINAEDCYNRTPLFYLFVNKKNEDPIVILSYLFENEGNKIQINKQDVFGNSVLFYAIEAKATFCISTLISKGADPKLVNKEGNSACGYSIINESTSITEIYAKINNTIEFEREIHEINRKHKCINEVKEEEKKPDTLERFFDSNIIHPIKNTNDNWNSTRLSKRRNGYGFGFNDDNGHNNNETELDQRLENLFGEEDEDLNEYQRNNNRMNMNIDTYENWFSDDNCAEEAENDLFNQQNMENEEENEKDDNINDNSEDDDIEMENNEMSNEEDEEEEDDNKIKKEKPANSNNSTFYSLSAVDDKYAFNYDSKFQNEINQLITKNYGKSIYEYKNSVTILKNKTQNNKEDEESEELDGLEEEENKIKVNETKDDIRNAKKDKSVTISSNQVQYYNISTLTDKNKISLFRHCLENNRQVFVFYMINQGFSIFKAIEESIKCGKITFTLTLVNSFSNPSILKQKNSLNQNLLHILALSNKSSLTNDQANLLYAKLSSQLDILDVDNHNNSPLHYACENKNAIFINLLANDLSNITEFNKKNKKNETPIDLLYKDLASETQLDIIVKVTQMTKQGDINSITKDLSKRYTKDLLPDFDSKKLKRNIQSSDRLYNLIALYQILTSNEISIMTKDSDGNDSLDYCAINGNSDLLFDIFLQEKDIKYDARNNKGKTLIHLIVSPNECGSYQDKDFLEKALEKGFKSTIKDNNNKLPIDYAIEFQYSLLEVVLKKYSSPSIIQTIKMDIDDEEGTSFEYDYIQDAEVYYNEVILPLMEKKKEMDSSIIDVDQLCKIRRENHKICSDSSGHLYNVDLTKVDSKKWSGGGLFIFYKMQLLHNIKKNMFILVTRWGTIGEDGQYQRTPFGTFEDAEKEFKTIFKSKTGNSWEKLVNNEFAFVHGKYNYQKTKKIDEIYDYVRTEAKKIELTTQSKINCDVFDWFKKLIANPFAKKPDMNQTSYHFNYISKRGIYRHADINEMIQLVYFEKDTLNKAFEYLDQMAYFVNKTEENNKIMNKTNINERNLSNSTSKFNQLHKENEENQNKLIELSEKYYQLIPISSNSEFYCPIVNEQSLNNEINRCISFTYSEKSLKLFLGSIRNINSIHPVDYVYLSLKTNITPMALENKGEIGMILNQIAMTSENRKVKITNVFNIQSKEKDANFNKDKLGNRVLLFHGTKARNLVGILSQGLLIAPVSAIQSGSSYGKGIYFTDFFSKAAQYSEASYMEKGFIFLCDVALGNVCQLNQKKQFKGEEALANQGYNSMISFAANHMDFNKKYYLNDGSALLPNLVVEERAQGIITNNFRMDHHAEYVVYNSNQAKVQYIIEVDQMD